MTPVVLLLLSGILFAGCDGRAVVTQPIQFSHLAHTENGLSCDVCHEFVEQASFAGIPTTDGCMICHQGAMTESPEEEKVRQYAEEGKDIPWQRIYEVPGDVYFSHRRHVRLAEIPCAECHGAVGESSVPLPRPAVAISMDRCTACHAERKVTNDCNACHR